jgi:hypothetical protein
MEMAGNVKLIPSLRKSLRARAMDRCLPTLETSKNLTVNQEVGGSNPPAPVPTTMQEQESLGGFAEALFT